jgi:hypothetical protein
MKPHGARLVLTLALAASPASAQVYSVNAVGYVNMTLGPGLSLLANPLNAIARDTNSHVAMSSNHLNSLLFLPESADGTVIFRFDPASQSYQNAVTFFAGRGWYPVSGNTNDPVMSLPPGEGFFLQPAGPTPLNITFVGEVLQGHLVNPIPPNASLKGSLVPQAAPLQTWLNFPATEGDQIGQWDAALQRYNFFVYAAGTWFPEEPTLRVAEGFLVRRDPLLATADRWWTRDFTVNPAPAPGLAAPADSTAPSITRLTIQGASVALSIRHSGGGAYHVQFSSDGLSWKTVAQNQTTALWSGPFPGGGRGQFRCIKP